LQKEGAEYDQLVKAAQDPTLSQASRDSKTDQARQKAAQIQQMQEQLQTKYQQSRSSLQNDKSLAETSLVEDVSKASATVAASKGFDMVLDKSGASLTSNSPVVFYVSPAVPDITNEVIAKLNAGAPRTAPAVTPAATH
jgi:Skp family chaperone for outer membrane proteins